MTVSSYNNLENGTPQGGLVNPFLYNILMENKAMLELPQGVNLFIFADDVCIAARERNKIHNLQRAVNMIIQKSKELGLKINSNKTKTLKTENLGETLLSMTNKLNGLKNLCISVSALTPSSILIRKPNISDRKQLPDSIQ